MSSRSAISRANLVAAAVASLGLALGGTGCFTSWAITQAAGGQRILDEGGREVAVPVPGVNEWLAVRLPLAVTYRHQLPSVGAQSVAPDPLPFALRCETVQRGRDAVYRAQYRYGKKWKYATAAMFVLEGALAAAYYYGSDGDQPQNQLAAGALALDAIGTAALFFAPRKEVFRTELRDAQTRVRTDCPDGMTLEIGGDSFPIDAAGGIGELGVVALEDWMAAPVGSLRVTYAGRAIELPVGHDQLCEWHRHHRTASTGATDPASPAGPGAAPSAGPVAAPSAGPVAAPGAGPGAQPMAGCPAFPTVQLREVYARLEVPMGTLTRVP